MGVRQLRRLERGSAPVFVAIVIPVLLAAGGGLVLEGGAKLRAEAHADAVASEAARAGGQVVSGQVLTGGAAAVDPYQAAAVARAWLAEQDVDGVVRIVEAGTAIEVITHISESTRLLQWAGVDSWDVSGHATAQLAQGPEDVEGS